MSLKRERNKLWWKNYREKNRIWLRVYSRNWYHKTKAKRSSYLSNYRFINKEKIRFKQTENNKKRRLEILGMLGSSCSKCGFQDYRALQIDHVNGGGSKERKNHSHSWSYKFWKKALTERKYDYQILCANCNWIKRYEKQELLRCP